MMNRDYLLSTCRDIIASSKVRQFVVGITFKPTERRLAYKRWAKRLGAERSGWVMLDWGLSPEEAVEIERFLFDSLVNHPGYGVIKMHYHPSVKPMPNQCVYLAWWSDWLVDATT